MRGLRPTELIIALLVFAIFIGVGVLDYSTRKQEANSYDSFSSFDYQRGGYRAWFDMLHDEGLPVARYQRRPAYLNDSIATLIVANNVFDAELRQELGQPSGTYSEADMAALAKWVKAGGHLIWLVDEGTSLMFPANLKVKIPMISRGLQSLNLPPTAKTGPAKDAATAISTFGLTSGVKTVLGTSRLRIPFGSDPSLTPLVADKAGSVAAWFPFGKGSVVVVTDESLFENGRLNKADNARLAYNLATFETAPGQTIAFEEWSHGYQSGDTWWSILPGQFKVAFVILVVAFGLLLLGGTWRFGPALRLPENTERTSLEYLTSVASLLERGHAARKAVRDMSALAMRCAARSVGLPETASASAIAQRVRGGEAGEKRADELLALERIAGYEHPTSGELLRAAQIAINLRKEFRSDGFQHIGPRRQAARRTA